LLLLVGCWLWRFIGDRHSRWDLFRRKWQLPVRRGRGLGIPRSAVRDLGDTRGPGRCRFLS
jgi:hypothetical protein